MGKAINRMYTANDKYSTVRLKIMGPKSILGRLKPFQVKVNVNITWISVLNDILKLEVPINEGIFLCTADRDRKNKAGYKWRTELTDKVRHYVNRYSRDRKVYTISIRHPDKIAFKKGSQNNELNKLQNETAVNARIDMPLPPPQPAIKPPPAVPSTSTGTLVPRLNSLSAVPRLPTPETSEVSWTPPIIDNVMSRSQQDNLLGNFFAGTDEDRISFITTSSQESEELRSQGIEKENLKFLAKTRSAKYKNDVLLRMKNEIRMLKQNGNWMKFLKRAPLSAHYLQDILGFLNDN